jgi:hypothetical protein
VVDLIQDPDVAGVQPQDTGAAPGNRSFRMRLVSEGGNGPADSEECFFVVAADAGQGTERRLPGELTLPGLSGSVAPW